MAQTSNSTPPDTDKKEYTQDTDCLLLSYLPIMASTKFVSGVWDTWDTHRLFPEVREILENPPF